jgi:hypothetical protein
MALTDNIQTLTGRTLSALEASHDYYTYTKRVWRLLQQIVKEGRKFAFRNLTTGTKVDEQVLLGRAQLYITDYLMSSTFQRFVSLFEDFFFELLRFWLAAYPGSLSKKQVEIGAVLKAPDKSAIILTVVDKELNELKYERLADWFAYLERLTNLGCPTTDEIGKLAEIKASRDILVHNNGIANATYVSKAGTRARYKDGERLEIPEPYHRASWETISRVVRDVFPPPPSGRSAKVIRERQRAKPRRPRNFLFANGLPILF